MFAVFTPVAWPAGSPGAIADPSGRTCIVSLVNKHGRPCRLKLKNGEEKHAVSRFAGTGPAFGRGSDVGLMRLENHCFPSSFELDAEAENQAGLPPLPFAYDNAAVRRQR